MQHFYRAYGLRIESDRVLPELTPWNSSPSSDIRFRWSGQANPSQTYCRIRRDVSLLEWPNVGRFELRNGRDVQIEAAPNVEDLTLRAYLLGPVLSTLLYQRDFLVLHASTIAAQGAERTWNAFGFLGHSGDGKSTMAASLHARGHRVVSDDVAPIPIDETASTPFPLIFPAFPQLRLWPGAVEALGEDASILPHLTPLEERRVRRVTQGFQTDAVPLRALIVLKHSDEITMRRFKPAEAMIELVQQTYCSGLQGAGEAAAQFQKCGALARTLPIWELRRPKDLSRLPEVAAFVETWWTHHLETDSVQGEL